jgi:L-asparaginase II
MIARWTGAPPSAILRAVDGCGVPVFGLPLRAMALSFARLAAAARRGEEMPSRVLSAVRQEPFMVGGSERFDTALIEDTGGAIVTKVGAEGVHCICVPELGLGAALKVLDGATRAQHPAVIQLCLQMGWLRDALTPRLAEFLQRPVRNTRGDVVGEVLPLELHRSQHLS